MKQNTKFSELVKLWLEKDCPNKKKQPRPGRFTDRARSSLSHPLAYWGDKLVINIRPSEISDYGAWRSKRVSREGCAGTRSADIELATCSSMAWWAFFSDLIPANPFAAKFRFHEEKVVEHSPARSPRTAEAVHAIGAHLLSNPRTASSGFLWLFLALTGARTGELRELRVDLSAEGQKTPTGWHGGSEIAIKRGKRVDNAVDIIRLSAPAQDLLRAWERWHASVGSVFWFPGKNKGHPLGVGSLFTAVKNACRKLGLPETISPHGTRSWFCSVLRTLEPDDRRVADALGHSNVEMIRRVYGQRSSMTDGLTWLPPSGIPGWAKYS